MLKNLSRERQVLKDIVDLLVSLQKCDECVFMFDGVIECKPHQHATKLKKVLGEAKKVIKQGELN